MRLCVSAVRVQLSVYSNTRHDVTHPNLRVLIHNKACDALVLIMHSVITTNRELAGLMDLVLLTNMQR